MKLHSITYQESNNTTIVWGFRDLILHPRINLIVGKNASGKTRIFNLLGNLADLLSGLLRDIWVSGAWDVLFLHEEDKKQTFHYQLEINAQGVAKETLSIDGITMLHRDADGTGKIYYEKIEKHLDFQISKQELAVHQKRDAIQHSYLEPLCIWAETMQMYPFATDMGREHLFSDTGTSKAIESLLPHERDSFLFRPYHLVEMYQKGKNIDGFDQKIKEDMRYLGYDLQSIGVDSFLEAAPNPLSRKRAYYLSIQEEGISHPIPQYELSQGMFRALSLLIHLNYFSHIKKHHPICILIDDIGEGLDFERSSRLIQLLIEKIEKQQIDQVQLIMTTNDRFVMNKVPLHYWTIIERSPTGPRFYNEQNSSKAFEEFDLIGLNNFDLFSRNFYKASA